MASKAQYIKRGEELIEIIPPAPTEQSRGGIIASPKTSTDTTEAKLGEDGKLYVNTSGASGISVSDVEPTDESSIWINPDTEESYTVPEINDETVSAEDTWSSEKINNQIEALNSKLGKQFSKNVPATSVPSSSETDLCTLTVERGVYIVTTHAFFNDNSSTAIGMRTLGIKCSGLKYAQTINKPYEWGTGAECVEVIVVNNDTDTIAMYASHSSNNALNVSGTMVVTRLK